MSIVLTRILLAYKTEIRRRSIRAIVLLAVVGLAQSAGSAAYFQQPARDRRPPAAAGTGRIRGSVVAADTGAPLRAVQLTLSGSRVRKSAATDANGQYEFTDLPAARYSLVAYKPGYVSTRFGAASPLRPGKSIELADGQTVTGVTVALPRGSVIAGRVLDEFGEPVLDATVRVMRYQSVNGQRRLVGVTEARQTDDLGEYRIFGLLPGSYYVSAAARNPDAKPADADPAAVELPRYAPTFYPGTADLAGAQRVAIGLGETRSNISFSLTAARTARIAGTAVDSQGQAVAGARIFLARREGAIAFRATLEARVKPDGSFEVDDVAPGDYVLQIHASSGGPGSSREMALVPVQVSGFDVRGLFVRTARGATARGQVVLEGADAGRFAFSQVEITARLAAADDAASGHTAAARVARDGTFELTGMVGPLLIRALNLTGAWALKSVSLGAEEITDTPVEFKPDQDVGGLRVVLTSRSTEVGGTVSGCQELSDEGCSILVFSADQSRWGPQTRFVRIVRPSQRGTYTIRGLPPGTYLGAAIPYIWQGEWYDSEFLEELRPHATAVRLADGQKQELNLTAVALQP